MQPASLPLSPLNYDDVLAKIGYHNSTNLPRGHTSALLKTGLQTIRDRSVWHRIKDIFLSLFGQSTQQIAEKSVAHVLKHQYSDLKQDPKGTAARAHRLVIHLLKLTTLQDWASDSYNVAEDDRTFIASLTPLFNTDFLAFSDPKQMDKLVTQRRKAYWSFLFQRNWLTLKWGGQLATSNETVLLPGSNMSQQFCAKVHSQSPGGTTKCLQAQPLLDPSIGSHLGTYLAYYPKDAPTPTVIAEVAAGAASGFQWYRMPRPSGIRIEPDYSSTCETFEALVTSFHNEMSTLAS